MSLLTRLAKPITTAPAPGFILLLAASVCLISGCGRDRQANSALSAPQLAPVASAKPGGAQAAKTTIPAEGRATAKITQAEPEVVLPPLEIVQQNPTFTWIENGKVSMKGSAKKFVGEPTNAKSGSPLSWSGVFLDFSAQLYENGKLTTSMKAAKVVANQADRTVLANGGVVLKSLDRGTVIESKWAKWFSRQNKIVGNGGVKFVWNMGGQGTMKGESAAFVADTALSRFEARDSAKGLLPE